MIVGEQTRIQGVIEIREQGPGKPAEELVVRGRVEGQVMVDGTVTVEAGAWLVADVQAREVVVRGTLRGNVKASGGIEVARTGRMLGDATAPRVAIATGAAFRGRLELGDLPEASSDAPDQASNAAAPAPTSRSVAAPDPAGEAPPPPSLRVVPAAPLRSPGNAAPGSVARPVSTSAAVASGVPPLARPRPVMRRRSE